MCCAKRGKKYGLIQKYRNPIKYFCVVLVGFNNAVTSTLHELNCVSNCSALEKLQHTTWQHLSWGFVLLLFLFIFIFLLWGLLLLLVWWTADVELNDILGNINIQTFTNCPFQAKRRCSASRIPTVLKIRATRNVRANCYIACEHKSHVRAGYGWRLGRDVRGSTDSGGPSLEKGPEDSSHTARLRTSFNLALDWNRITQTITCGPPTLVPEQYSLDP